ncbi:hypothetical protein FKM82_001323 [Ascaphus truei]
MSDGGDFHSYREGNNSSDLRSGLHPRPFPVFCLPEGVILTRCYRSDPIQPAFKCYSTLWCRKNELYTRAEGRLTICL